MWILKKLKNDSKQYMTVTLSVREEKNLILLGPLKTVIPNWRFVRSIDGKIVQRFPIYNYKPGSGENREPETVFVPQIFVPKNGQWWQPASPVGMCSPWWSIRKWKTAQFFSTLLSICRPLASSVLPFKVL